MRRVALLGCLLGACHPASETVTIPSDVAYVAWAIEDDDGVVTYTALSSVDEARVFSVGADARAVLLGFDERVGEVIERFGIDPSRDPLAAATEACGPRIAEPKMLHAQNDASIAPGPLTASWVDDVCAEDRFLVDGVNCDVCVEPDCRGVEVQSNPITVDPVYSVYTMQDVTWIDDETLLAKPDVQPDRAVARISYDRANPEQIAVRVEPLSNVGNLDQLHYSDGSLWLVEGRRIHRATTDVEILGTLDLPERAVVRGMRDGPAIVYIVGGPAFELSRTTLIERDDLPAVINALDVVGIDEIVAIDDDDLVWQRGTETYRHPLPEPYTQVQLAAFELKVTAVGDTALISGRDVPVSMHTRGDDRWVETSWPIAADTGVRDVTALAGGFLVVGRYLFNGALMYVRDERTCFIRFPEGPPLNAVAVTPGGDIAVAVTEGQGIRAARLIDVRAP